MTPHQILIAVIRLLALLWFLYLASNVGTFYATAEALESMDIGLGILWTLGMVQLAACAFMWCFPGTLASKLLRGATQPISSGGPAEHWQAPVPIGVGLWVLAGAVPDLAYWLMFFALSRQDEVLQGVPTGVEQIASLSATLISLAIGAWLILSGPLVTQLLLRARVAGSKSKLPSAGGE